MALTVETEPLPLVPALILGYEVLEVVARIIEGADLVDIVDEVANKSMLASERMGLLGRRLRRARTRAQRDYWRKWDQPAGQTSDDGTC